MAANEWKWRDFPIFRVNTVKSGDGEIRTRDTVSRIHTFQACSFNHSDTSPLKDSKNRIIKNCPELFFSEFSF